MLITLQYIMMMQKFTAIELITTQREMVIYILFSKGAVISNFIISSLKEQFFQTYLHGNEEKEEHIFFYVKRSIY